MTEGVVQQPLCVMIPSRQDHPVVSELAAAGDLELGQQVGDLQLLLLLAGDVVDDVALVHHDEAVAVLDGILHIVGDHHGGQMVFFHDLGRKGQHLERGLGVQRGGVLVQQQELGLVHGGHQQGQSLTLAAGKQTHAGGKAILQAEVEALEQLAVALPLRLGDADAQPAPLAAAGRQRKVLLDLHGGGGAGHGVLEDAADVGGTLVLAQLGHIDAVNEDLALVHGPDTGHRVQHGGLTRAVAADDGDEVPLVQLQVQAVQRGLLVDGTGVEGLGYVLDLKHFLHPPSSWRWAWQNTCPSNTAPRGTRPRPKH